MPLNGAHGLQFVLGITPTSEPPIEPPEASSTCSFLPLPEDRPRLELCEELDDLLRDWVTDELLQLC